MILVFYIIFALYFFCMMALLIGFRKLKVFSLKDFQPLTPFSIIVPFRNEAENLPILLKSIAELKYPIDLFEVILINDSSEDNSEGIIRHSIENSGITMELIQNKRVSNSPKKDAISEAIKKSKFNWLATTDADCQLPKNWLKTLDGFIQTARLNGNRSAPFMICGPVLYKTDGSFLQDFQLLDGISLQAAAMGSFGLKIPILCNGANLAYKKDAFEHVGGFSGNDHIASGDDIFLMEKMKKSFPDRVKFLNSPELIVFTKPQPSWKELINQRIRWASKTTRTNNGFSLLTGGIILLTNLVFLFLPLAVIFDLQNSLLYLMFLVLKILIDFALIRLTAHFFNQPISFFKFPIMAMVYSSVIVMVAFEGLNGKYSWKGRTFQNRDIID